MADMAGATTTDSESRSRPPSRPHAHPSGPAAHTPASKPPSHLSAAQLQQRSDSASTGSTAAAGEQQGKDASIVHVFGAPSAVSDSYMHDLCSTWGTVVSVSRQASKLVPGAQEMVIVFSTAAEAEEALRHLHGGVLFRSPLRASLRSSLVQQHLETFSKPLSPQEEAQQAAGGPRNLYVLNLSLDMTNQELLRLFSVFGTVNHVCIMAVLDSLGRRRAFVDMATGEAARQAIASFHGTSVHGYKIDVSFAIIQRSGGPVTDYPPTPLKRAQQASLHLSKHLNASASAICRQQIQMQAHADIYPSLSATNGNELVPFTPQQAISPFFDHHAMNPSFMHVPMTIPPLGPMALMQPVDLYVTSLDPAAILDDEDLSSLFKQFGTVVGAKLALDTNGHSMGVGFVRMSNPQEAEHAMLQMHGRVMDSKRISVTLSPPVLTSPTYSSYGSPMLGSVASSIYPSPMTPYMSPWHSTPVNYTTMPHVVNEQDMSPLMMGMAGLGISHMASPISIGLQYPADLLTHQSRGTTYFTHMPQETSIKAKHTSNFAPDSSLSSSQRGEDSLAQSSHNSALSLIHSREVSVETSATSNQGESLDIKAEEASESDGRAEALLLTGSLSASVPASSKASGNAINSVLAAKEGFGERGRAATSETVLRSSRKPQLGKNGFMVSKDGSPLRRNGGCTSKARMLSRRASATDI